MNADLKWLDDPQIFRVGKLPAHSDHAFYRSLEEMKQGTNTLEQSLDGQWKFHYSQNSVERPADFYKEDFDFRSFDEIKVPCHIEMAGYDRIHYINTMYPWEGHFHRRPAYALSKNDTGEGMFSEADYNPVGSYVKEFDLAAGLCPLQDGKRMVIRFEGVEQAMFVWLNGQFIGYSEDSFTPAEFDLTPYIKEKGNRLAVEVHKRSTAAYLEDQDFFRFFGIFRSVKLFAQPSLHVEDLWAKPVLCEDGTGSLSVECKLTGKAKTKISLFDGAELLAEKEVAAEAATTKETAGNEEGLFSFGIEIAEGLEVTKWEHKNPKLYLLLIQLYDENGLLTEVVPYEIGFRRIEIKNNVIYFNGERLKICGVNRHEWNARCGRAIGLSDMEEDMKVFQKNHINAVRTCHYPDQIPWYYMCDKAGIYMMAETNLESHGSWMKLGGLEPSWNVPGSVPEWKAVVLDRAANNFEAFKNHPAVLFWSLGNESYAGDNIAAMNKYFKDKQDGRLVHYEGVCWNREYEDVISDVESRMYAKPNEIREYLDNDPKKPFLLCEYMHDMGNSIGGMNSYMKLFDDYENYHGGFIWDYMDQAILVKDEVTGREVMRYGGDFDDRPADYDFSGNGIVFADRTEKPAMQEVNYYYGLYE